jgi:uncharacterized delta-60 repeat protein
MKKHILRSALIVALLATIFTSVPAAQAAPGNLDTTFAGFTDDGTVFETGIQTANSVALQPDGKTVVVGSTETSNQLAVFRYLPNGQLDSSFDGDGKAIFPDMFVATDVALQSDGRIVVGGRGNAAGFHLARLTPGGALDTSFNGDGWFKDTDIRLGYLYAILVQRDSKIVACGNGDSSSGGGDFAVTRYNANGSRDSSFGNGLGMVFIGFGAGDTCNDMVQQADGKLVLAGIKWAGFAMFDDSDFAVARLNPDGTRDNSFDGDGRLTTGFGGDEGADAVALQPDGKIVVLGTRAGLPSYPSYMARYLPNGKLDTTFDGDGKRTIPVDSLYDLALQPDGKLLAQGYHKSPDGDYKFALHRLLPSGAHDLSFGENGIRFLDFGGQDVGNALALLPDGRILAAGTKGGAAVLARLWPDGTTLDTGGQQTHAIVAGSAYPPGSAESGNALAVQSDGRLLVAGEVRNAAGTRSDAFLSRFLADGQIDASFGASGTSYGYSGTINSARAIAVQSDGKIIIAGYTAGNGLTDDFLIARFHPNGFIDRDFGESGAYRLDFAGGGDRGTAMALAPDGKIIVAGIAWNGTRHVWGVARLTSSGMPDSSFYGTGGPGKAFLDFGPGSTANAVVVQPDGKVVLGGKTSGDDFTLARLLVSGAPDNSFGPNSNGSIITDMGGADSITSLALASNGWIYAAGYSWRGGADDFALAQYRPNGILAQCPAGQTCSYWPQGKRYISLGGSDSAYALVLRGDNQLVVAGCSDWHMAAAQVSTTEIAQPILFHTDFVGHFDCAFGVQFSGTDKGKIVLAGHQAYDSDTNIALARFQTTAYGSTALPAADEQTTQDATVPTPPPMAADEQTTQDTAVPTPSATPPLSAADEQTTQDTAVPAPAPMPPPDQLISDTVTLSTTVSSELVRP